ncbi:MAG: hypothetical protein MUE49_06725 [Rhodospirillales bacterium]|nr:hypothetical protein [Rhodospirillales bacterium]
MIEIARALFGVWRIVHFDRRALGFFDLSTAGALRSFTAAVLVAPIFATLTALRFDSTATTASPGRYTLVEAISYVIAWTMYPVIMESLTRSLGCRARFPAYLCVYNWTMVLQNTVVMVLALLGTLRLLPADAVAILGFAVLAITAGLLWFIARLTLGVPSWTAVGFVFLDLLVSVLISSTSDMLQ